MEDFEKLGAFYLGREYDLATKEMGGLLLYDSKDLVTHGVCVGMTGSGKTGLCIGLLEEAALDGIPAIVIDPKGDLANLLLTFPELRAGGFPALGERGGGGQEGPLPRRLRPASRPRRGRRAWPIGARTRRASRGCKRSGRLHHLHARLQRRAAGEHPQVVRRARRRPCATIDEALQRPHQHGRHQPARARWASTADPIQSREHILLSSLFDAAWSAGQDLDLAGLIQQIQTPPFAKVGVLDLESFYPAKDRFELAMLHQQPAGRSRRSRPGWRASRSTSAGCCSRPRARPRVSIFSIAHLSDAERMFFVSLLLNEVLGWVRAQPGTGSLRAILYMDEIFGFFPPVAEPPSKRPLLTLLKQARAFGVGVLLATQNPVDLDYKGLANAGTWFIGRLQTERDKDRLLGAWRAWPRAPRPGSTARRWRRRWPAWASGSSSCTTSTRTRR